MQVRNYLITPFKLSTTCSNHLLNHLLAVTLLLPKQTTINWQIFILLSWVMIVRIIWFPARLVPMSWRRNARFFDVHIEKRNSGAFRQSIDIIECTFWRMLPYRVYLIRWRSRGVELPWTHCSRGAGAIVSWIDQLLLSVSNDLLLPILHDGWQMKSNLQRNLQSYLRITLRSKFKR